MRLLTCSNSAPRLISDGGMLKPSPDVPGGLVPIIAALLQEVGGHWIFAAPGGDRRTEMNMPPVQRESPWHPLPLDEGLFERQRESINIRTLLWLFHYLHDTSVQPSFDQSTKPAWQAYRQVNREFSDVLVNLHQNDSDEVVLVNDFHLMLVPLMFSDSTQKRNSTLAYFHHVPWCEPDYFGILPEWMRSEILRSLLRCDFVGFHCRRWGDAFLACCHRFLPDAEVVGRTVAYRDHETVVATAPGPIDAQVLAELRDQPETERWRNVLLERASGREIITRVDRIDLWKNLIRGFSAYEMLLRQNPSLVADFWFCAIVTPPRLLTDRHKNYQALCEETVKRINEQYSGEREAIGLIYWDGSGRQRNRAAAALTIGAATLVNPTYDGLNMVAKESIVLNPRAPLLLSVNAGVYPQLATCATAIQPFDVAATAAALAQVTEGRAASQPDAADTCLASVQGENAAKWLQAILTRSQRNDL
jgi:trehalose 6-phosphate synthase